MLRTFNPPPDRICAIQVHAPSQKEKSGSCVSPSIRLDFVIYLDILFPDLSLRRSPWCSGEQTWPGCSRLARASGGRPAASGAPERPEEPQGPGHRQARQAGAASLYLWSKPLPRRGPEPPPLYRGPRQDMRLQRLHGLALGMSLT